MTKQLQDPEMYLPRPLYRAMPAIYAAAGAATVAFARFNMFAVLSGLMLILAGGVISYWRFRHRAQYDARLSARLAFETRKPRSRGQDVQVG